MARLEGKRIAITASRKTDEMSTIVKKLGGIPLLRTAQVVVEVEAAAVDYEVSMLLDSGVDWVILTTAIGSELLTVAANRIGKSDDWLWLLRETHIAARGYKTIQYLKTLGVEATVRDEDGTTSGLLRALQTHDFQEKHVAVQLYGDSAPRLMTWLIEQNADIHEIFPYRHVPPNILVMNKLLSEIIAGQIDAVTFNSTPQVRYVMAYAREQGLDQQLVSAFQTVIAVAVGKVTAEALKEEGIDRVVTPDTERMGSMMMALAKYFEDNT